MKVDKPSVKKTRGLTPEWCHKSRDRLTVTPPTPLRNPSAMVHCSLYVGVVLIGAASVSGFGMSPVSLSPSAWLRIPPAEQAARRAKPSPSLGLTMQWSPEERNRREEARAAREEKILRQREERQVTPVISQMPRTDAPRLNPFYPCTVAAFPPETLAACHQPLEVKGFACLAIPCFLVEIKLPNDVFVEMQPTSRYNSGLGREPCVPSGIASLHVHAISRRSCSDIGRPCRH